MESICCFFVQAMRMKKLSKTFILANPISSSELPKLTIRELCDFRQSGIFAHDEQNKCL
jgi:hypothetical protein